MIKSTSQLAKAIKKGQQIEFYDESVERWRCISIGEMTMPKIRVLIVGNQLRVKQVRS